MTTYRKYLDQFSGSEAKYQLSSYQEAAHAGHINVVRAFIKVFGKQCVDIENSYGETALSRAIGGSEFKIAEYLLSQGADINKRTVHGGSPLHYQCMVYDGINPQTIRFLIAHGANPALENSKGKTPDQLAQPRYRKEVAALFVEKPVPIDHDIIKFINAAGGGRLAEVQAFIDKFGSKYIDRADSGNETALYRSLRSSHFDVAKFLIEKGASVNSTVGYSGRLLKKFTLDNRAKAASFLLDHGADIEMKDSEGKNLLILAIDRGCNDTAILLLDRGIDRYKTHLEGVSALDYALQNSGEHEQPVIDVMQDMDRKEAQAKKDMILHSAQVFNSGTQNHVKPLSRIKLKGFKP